MRLKSPGSPLFNRPFNQAQIKENIKAPRHWPLCGEFTGDRWITGLHTESETKLPPFADISNAFYCNKFFASWLIFHWLFFPKVEFTLVPNRQQAIIWTECGLDLRTHQCVTRHRRVKAHIHLPVFRTHNYHASFTALTVSLTCSANLLTLTLYCNCHQRIDANVTIASGGISNISLWCKIYKEYSVSLARTEWFLIFVLELLGLHAREWDSLELSGNDMIKKMYVTALCFGICLLVLVGQENTISVKRTILEFGQIGWMEYPTKTEFEDSPGILSKRLNGLSAKNQYPVCSCRDHSSKGSRTNQPRTFSIIAQDYRPTTLTLTDENIVIDI